MSFIKRETSPNGIALHGYLNPRECASKRRRNSSETLAKRKTSSPRSSLSDPLDQGYCALRRSTSSVPTSGTSTSPIPRVIVP